VISWSRDLVATQQTQETNVRPLRWIRTRHPSSRAAADPTPYTARPPGSANIDIATRFLHALAPSDVFTKDKRLVGVMNDPAGNILTWVIVRKNYHIDRRDSILDSCVRFFVRHHRRRFLVSCFCRRKLYVKWPYRSCPTANRPNHFHMQWRQRLFTLGIVNLDGACNWSLTFVECRV
jgi:hypothetical protein